MIPKELARKIRAIQVHTRKAVTDILAGEYHSVFKGRGMAFDEVREYQPGDDVRAIDWNVTARTGQAFIKQYVEERELTVLFLVDLSASGGFGSTAKLKNELAAEFSALLAFSAIRNNDKVGLIAFTDAIELFIPPKKGGSHVLRLIRELLYFSPRGRGTDIVGALDYLGRVARKRAVVFLISDFLAPDFAKPMRVLAKRHDLIAVSVTDPRELELPDVGLISLADAETGRTVVLDTGSRAVRQQFSRAAKARQAELAGQFAGMGVDHIGLDTAQDYVPQLVRFFKRRALRR